MKIKVWCPISKAFIKPIVQTDPFVWSGYVVVMISRLTGDCVYVCRKSELDDVTKAIARLF